MITRIPPTGVTQMNYISAKYLDTVNDPVCGDSVSSGTGASPRAGQLGNILRLSMSDAKKRGSAITLYAGDYQYVRFKASTTAAGIQGRLVFWDAYSSTYASNGMVLYQVTPDATTANSSGLAGIALGTMTAGYYGWIQISGLANVLCAATIVDNTQGDIAFIETALTGAVGAADFATYAAATALQLCKMFGYAYQTPVAGASKLVNLI
jgi:hypothetical protein